MRKRLLLIVAVLALAGCAGTVQRADDSKLGQNKLVGASYKKVEIILTNDARRAQADNPQFNPQELAGYLQRRMDSHGLLTTDAAYVVEVTIEDFRVRSTASAVLLGVMAGTDSISGRVRVVDGSAKQVHSFAVNASYGLGGWGGGQDGTRMTWLYDKFSELTLNELMGDVDPAATTASSRKQGRPLAPIVISPGTPTPQGDTTVAVVSGQKTSAMPTSQTNQTSFKASGYASLDDVDAIPYLNDKGRDQYRAWLKQSTPRAFALSTTGAYSAAFGLKSTDATEPTDPSQRALTRCNRVSKVPCSLYAVNGSVVWVPAPFAPPSNATHAVPVPPSTGFAELSDVNAVPKLGPKGKELYQEWLTKPFPRAVAVSDQGAMARGYGANAMQQAMQNCEKLFTNPCRLYAVDDQVVWKPQ